MRSANDNHLYKKPGGATVMNLKACPANARNTIRRNLGLGLLAACALSWSAAGGAAVYTELRQLTTAEGKGHSWDGLVQGRDGRLYGTRREGGAGNAGTAFRISTGGAFTKLHDFNGAVEGRYSQGLTLGRDGNFYGAAGSGGPADRGTVYRMTPNGSVTVLHAFGATGPQSPFGPPVQGRDGALYGVAMINWSPAGNEGVVYRVTTSGVFSVIATIGLGGPSSPLLIGKDGNFYGSTLGVDISGGVISRLFRLTPGGTLTWFGAAPAWQFFRGMMQAGDGNFYALVHTYDGESRSLARITPTGSVNVADLPLGVSRCDSTPIPATDGQIYVGCGNDIVVFSDGDVSGNSVHYFPAEVGGWYGAGTLVQHTNGMLYGTTFGGGNNNAGVIYSLSIGATPFVKAIPNAAPVGSSIGLLGNFTNATAVKFNGVSANFSGLSNTYRTASVPAGPATGIITVENLLYPFVSNLASDRPFQVLPRITSRTPASGPVGSSVVIRGSGFSQTTSVLFAGNKPSRFVVNSDSQITAPVPAGAVSGGIRITTQGGTATTASFTVSP
ncbi:choice-of-anchor tandem repeat GloVer-containing protein [Methylolobus aquaticus]